MLTVCTTRQCEHLVLFAIAPVISSKIIGKLSGRREVSYRRPPPHCRLHVTAMTLTCHWFLCRCRCGDLCGIINYIKVIFHIGIISLVTMIR